MRNGSPAVQSRGCSAAEVDRARFVAGPVRAPSSGLVVPGGARGLPRPPHRRHRRESATRSGEPEQFGISEQLGVVDDERGLGGSPSGGRHASTVSPERRGVAGGSQNGGLARSDAPVIRTLTGTVRAFASSRRSTACCRRDLGEIGLRRTLGHGSYPPVLHGWSAAAPHQPSAAHFP